MALKKRNGFVSGIGFILAAAGSAVGLGNLWSFPYKTSANGGSAFVILYVLSVIVLGSVIMIAEIYLGKRSQANPISACKNVNKNLGWLGLFAIIIPFVIICYYSVLGGYTVKYALNSFNSNSTILESFTGNVGEVIVYVAIFIAMALFIVMAGVKYGIEKASKVLMPALFVLLVVIVVYCLCLGDGVKEGLAFYLKPDFSALGFKGVLAAMGQAFFSLSLGMGIMISYGSYTDNRINLGKSVFMICLFDTAVALLAGLAIFPAVYHFQALNGGELSVSGPALLFVSLPKVFDNLGVVGQLASLFFFGMVVIAALTSVISLLEVVTQFVIQKFKVRRQRAILVVATICFAVAIPVSISLGLAFNGDSTTFSVFGQDLLTYFDDVTNAVLMPVCALGSCITVGWFIDKKITANPFETLKSLEEDGLKVGWFGKIFAVMVKYVAPLLIIVIEVFGVIGFIDGSSYGYCVVITAVALIAISAGVYFLFFVNSDTGCNADEIDIELALREERHKKEEEIQKNL